MNKQERKLKGLYKYKKLLRNYRLQGTNHNVLRNTGKPCSCYMCCNKGRLIVTGEKKKVYKEIQFELAA